MPHQKFKTRREWNDAAIWNRDIARTKIKLHCDDGEFHEKSL
jgi:hypothetical protein